MKTNVNAILSAAKHLNLQWLLCLLFLFVETSLIKAQGGPPAPPSIYTDGPIELKVRVREINTVVDTSDGSFGFSPDDYTYKLWIRDNSDLDNDDWQGGQCLTADFDPPALSPDFNLMLFDYIYAGDTVPMYFDVRMEAWEDDIPADPLSGQCSLGLRCDFDCCNFCCGAVVFGNCVGVREQDDNHCDGNPFVTNVDYRLGAPGQWYDHGYITGSCGSTYLPHIESYWNYVNVTVDSVSGKVISETGAAIQSTKLVANGSGSAQATTTGIDGAYLLLLNSVFSYTVTPTKSNDISTGNGITSMDVLLIRRHILGTLLSSPYKIIAADVDSSGDVSVVDVLLVRSMILQNISIFPGNKLWSFVPHDFVFADPTNPFPYDTSRYYASVSSLTNQDFIGMKLGDVNNSWDPNVPKNESFAGKVYLKTDCTTSVQAGEEITIHVRVKQFENVSGMQFTLNWNQDALTFQSVEKEKLQADFATQKADEGMLGVLWTDENAKGRTLDEDEVLFSLRFIANKVGEECDVNITSAMIPIEAVNENLQLLELGEWKDESTSVDEEFSHDYRVYQNYPNPFSESTIVSFELPEEETVTIEVFDLLGKKVGERKAVYDAGKHNIEFSGTQFSSGVYYLQFKTENFSRSFKIVRLKKP